MKKVKLVADPYPPYQFEESGTISGVDHEIISEAFRIHDIDIEARLCKWEECIGQMEDRRADGMFQITRTPDRENKFLFSDTLRVAKTVFFKREGNSISFNRDVDITKQLYGLKIGVLSGYSYNTDIDSLSDELKVTVEQAEHLLQGLVQGEFDLALLDVGVDFYLIGKLNLEGIKKTSGYEIERILYVAFQKDLVDIVELFNSGLRKIKKKGLYDEILNKYGL